MQKVQAADPWTRNLIVDRRSSSHLMARPGVFNTFLCFFLWCVIFVAWTSQYLLMDPPPHFQTPRNSPRIKQTIPEGTFPSLINSSPASITCSDFGFPSVTAKGNDNFLVYWNEPHTDPCCCRERGGISLSSSTYNQRRQP